MFLGLVVDQIMQHLVSYKQDPLEEEFPCHRSLDDCQ